MNKCLTAVLLFCLIYIYAESKPLVPNLDGTDNGNIQWEADNAVERPTTGMLYICDILKV